MHVQQLVSIIGAFLTGLAAGAVGVGNLLINWKKWREDTKEKKRLVRIATDSEVRTFGQAHDTVALGGWKRFAKRLEHPIFEHTITATVIGGIILSAMSALGGYMMNVWLTRAPSWMNERVFSEADLSSKHRCIDYQNIFSKDGRVVDAGNNMTWIGKDQIQVRCLQLPRFDFLEHKIIDHQVFGDWAAASTKTKEAFNNGTEFYDDFENWVFRKEDGNWKIQRFEYNLKPK